MPSSSTAPTTVAQEFVVISTFTLHPDSAILALRSEMAASSSPAGSGSSRLVQRRFRYGGCRRPRLVRHGIPFHSAWPGEAASGRC